MTHPFGELLKQYRKRKPGLSQARLAHHIGYDEAVLVRMSQGKKDLTGPSGRDRVVSLIEILRIEGVLSTLDEANALLATAGLPPLYAGISVERKLIQALRSTTIRGHTSVSQAPTPHYTLPAPVSSFIGRDHEVADVTHLLRSARLITLTGAGGSGKTRLALESGSQLAGAFAHGVCFVELAPVRKADDVVPAIARALNVHESPGTPLLDLIRRFLASKSILLLLDNFEHVLESALKVTEMLVAAPNVKVLATSREPLRLSGEHVYFVEPLELPRAVELFSQRAQSMNPEFRLNDGAVPIVTDICRRMDCLPLAIELAAARMREFSPAGLLENLNQRRGLSVLTDAPRDVPARHQTLRNAIAWSFDLLDHDEQRVLRALGVFFGGAEFEQIAITGGWHEEPAALPLLSEKLRALVDKSFVRAAQQPDGATRYLLLELIREFVTEHLLAHGVLNAAQRAHAGAFLCLAREGMWAIRSHEQLRWHDRFERDYPNFREALTWSFGDAGSDLLGCQLVEALAYFWFIATRYVSEMRAWIVKAHAVNPLGLPPSVRGGVCASLIINGYVFPFAEWVVAGEEALTCYNKMPDIQGTAIAKYGIGAGLLMVDPHDARGPGILQECLALCQQEGNEWLRSHALQALVVNAMDANDMVQAENFNREMLQACRAVGNLVEVSVALWQLADLITRLGRYQEANEFLREAILLARQLDSTQDMLRAQSLLGNNMRALGDTDGAIQVIEACLVLARSQRPVYEVVQPLIFLGRAENERGNHANADALFGEAVQIMRASNWPSQSYFGVLSAFAIAADLQGDAIASARLWGAADMLRATSTISSLPQDIWEYAPCISNVRAALGDTAYASAYAEGQALTLDQTLTIGLSRYNASTDSGASG